MSKKAINIYLIILDIIRIMDNGFCLLSLIKRKRSRHPFNIFERQICEFNSEKIEEMNKNDEIDHIELFIIEEKNNHNLILSSDIKTDEEIRKNKTMKTDFNKVYDDEDKEDYLCINNNQQWKTESTITLFNALNAFLTKHWTKPIHVIPRIILSDTTKYDLLNDIELYTHKFYENELEIENGENPISLFFANDVYHQQFSEKWIDIFRKHGIVPLEYGTNVSFN